ncbi:MAG: tRNA epoxyqueuosine(34) reductase QueG [Anaerolineae bacterium]
MARYLRHAIEARARELGFTRAGFCAVSTSAPSAAAYRLWSSAGMGGEMAYMSRPDRVARALDPRLTLPEARSMVVVTLDYASGLPGTDPTAPNPPATDDPSRGVVARYARGPDYHDVMLPGLEQLGSYVAELTGGRADAGSWRAYVDTGPVLERDAASRAGLGFVGRNTMLIERRRGSWLFVGVLLVEADLLAGAADPFPDPPGSCGRCTRCLDACPTGAFAAPYVLDARRCISYLTIELKGPIPRDLRPLMGNLIFGCDVCNDVCPYNLRRSRGAGQDAAATWSAPGAAPLGVQLRGGEPGSGGRAVPAALPLLDLLELDDLAFAESFQGTPLARSRRRGLLRSVCVALGNWGSVDAVPGLRRALGDREPLIRGHAAWALGRIGTSQGRAALEAARTGETDTWVAEEIQLAIDACREQR